MKFAAGHLFTEHFSPTCYFVLNSGNSYSWKNGRRKSLNFLKQRGFLYCCLNLDSQRSLEMIHRQEGEVLPSDFHQPSDLPKQKMIHAQLQDSLALVCQYGWRDRKLPGNCKSLWAEESCLEEVHWPVGSVWPGALRLREGKHPAASSWMGSHNIPADLHTSLLRWGANANVPWSESGHIHQHFGRMASTAASICLKFTPSHWRGWAIY